MKFAIVASIFASGALAQLATITSALTAIQSDTAALDAGVNSYSGAADTASLQSLATTLINELNSANSAVSGSPVLAEMDALSLVGPVNALATAVMTATDDVVSKKSTFDAAGAGFDILTNLQNIQSAANTFSNTLISKVPESLASEAQILAAPITSALASAVQAYQGETQPTSTGSVTPTGPTTITSSSAISTSTGTITTSTIVTPITTTTSSVGTITPISNSTTTPLVPFNAAPTAAAGYGVIALAALGAIAAL